MLRWAEYSPWRFRQRLAKHRLGTFDLHIFNGRALQEGSNIQEYREFVRSLEVTKEQPIASGRGLTVTLRVGWLMYLGVGGATVVVCWIGCQCWYSGIRVLKTRGSAITTGRFCTVLCCGLAALLEKPEHQRVTGLGRDQWDLRDSDLDSVKIRAYWSRVSSDTDRTTELIVEGTTSQVTGVPES